MTAAFVNLAGTKITEVSAFVAAIASLALLKTGIASPSKSTTCPPLPGVTPPTTFVPDASILLVCLLPSDPVIPCTRTRLFSFKKIAIYFATPLEELANSAARLAAPSIVSNC